ncbi:MULTISPECIES: Zn-dependent alcohol dehydrogenase [Arthrobacter]|uniref:Zn-dependent alcohol dehydrogenase n=1 Tax=Arthrobacter TaxID=1663 RepID=UPI00254CD31E|nr:MULTISPECIES: Zn-dependent alcohol dehydrogenase [Arthrobacter]MDQ0212189.1 alcohol dehydrogenase/S-(hydroxymethyl)glutathione dehydrogenase/alcohol dehydrogenase [Arthrobacter bambusae]MDQ0236592.1 alcohol dehydrogenase/S-(hydroxymethyl)glutathione dehydrogenase/alcohol dehydrogenase [Arthrobacter bambusae]
MSTQILAAVLEKPGAPLQIRELLLDDPEDYEVLIRTERVGLCHSDLHYLKGSLDISLPAVLGHEVAGIVERVGSAVTRIKTGDRVVVTVTPSCGACRNCIGGRPTQCERVDSVRERHRPRLLSPDGSSVESLGGIGAFAEAFLVKEASVAAVGSDLPPQVACLLGCCISTGVGAVIHGAKVGPEDTVAVIGCGGVGIAAIQGARLAGARRIIAIDAVPAKLELARNFGATDTVVSLPDPTETLIQVRSLLPQGVSHAIEAVGRSQTAELAFSLLSPNGTATILGLMPTGSELRIPADALVYGDRHLQGAYMGANRFLSDVDMFTDHYLNNRLDLDAMVTKELPFVRINEGFEAMAEASTIRVVLNMTDRQS